MCLLVTTAASSEAASAPSISEPAPASSVPEAPPVSPASASPAPASSLGAEDPALASHSPAAPASSSAAHVLEHRGVLEHVGEDHEADLGAPDVDMLQLGHAPVPVGHRHARHLAVHVVLSLDQLSAVYLQCFMLGTLLI